jgi:CHAT domain-containing protein/Tfp pilus assembly protein PilF
LISVLLWFAATGLISCGGRPNSPQTSFDCANQAFLRGELTQSQEEAARGYRQFGSLSPEWAWKFLILEAKAALARGLFPRVLDILKSQPLPNGQTDLAVSVSTLAGVANVHLRNFSEADRLLNHAEKLCRDSALDSCGDLIQARGLMASEQNQSALAEKMYELSLAFARSHHDAYLEVTSLLNLGDQSLDEGRFDEAIDRSEAAYRAAKVANAEVLELITQGNIGWAYYKLGDSEKALQLSNESERAAARLGDVYDRGNELTNLGYIYMDARKFELAATSFQKALDLAEEIGAQQDIYNASRVLARLALETGDLDQASKYAQKSLNIARAGGNRQEELYPQLVIGQINARRGEIVGATQTFEAVANDPACPNFLKWEAQRSMARLYEAQSRPDLADGEYRAALATFEKARAAVKSTDSLLSFLANASSIYDDYIRFLVAHGKTDEALRWADYGRARTLAEGLGLIANAPDAGPPPLHAQEIARRAHGAILFYWLGDQKSYLWAITPRRTSLCVLPPAATIEEVVRRYRQALNGPQDTLEITERDGQSLYQMLIAPARPLLPIGSRIFIVPDGGLNNLNFETLIVSDANAAEPVLSKPKFHYWIEDVTVANASSLRILAASNAATAKNENEHERNLLLIGDSISPSNEYPELPKADAQMKGVARHFPPTQERIFARQQANAAAYLQSNPEQYAYIHFVAHGTASRLSPLDSAIVLSRGSAQGDSFKLYARDIVRHPLQADLVTISACYSAGERSYTGEGLVGLSWAFLRAGAHNVIAALWDVTDASTELLMDRFYEETNRGANPENALRAAKLFLLRHTKFQNPFYWAPFQLYARLDKSSSIPVGRPSSSKNGIAAELGRTTNASRLNRASLEPPSRLPLPKR